MTARARTAARDQLVTPKLPRPDGVTPAPTGERTWRTGPQKGASYRSFGTVAATRGRWKAFYTGPDRRRHTPGQTFSNPVRAQGWLAQELALIERGEWTPPARRRQATQAASTTFEEFARDWIDTRMVHGRPLKARTKEHYLDLLDRWFAPLHSKPLTAITQTDIERWHRNLPEASTMRAHAYSLLKSIFKTAVTRKLIKESPVQIEGATVRNKPKDVDLLTIDQVQALADAMPPRHHLIVLLGAWCGLRFGEITALQRSDIRLDEGTLKVERAVVTVAGERVVTTTKSTAGNRTIYLPPHIAGVARRHLDVYTRPEADALVFPGRDGQPLTPMQVYGHAPRIDPSTGKQVHPGGGFYRARHKIGRPDFRFHDLRHFAATMAAISGATTKELMQFAGHSDIHVAMRYQEALTDRKKELAQRMTDLVTADTAR